MNTLIACLLIVSFASMVLLFSASYVTDRWRVRGVVIVLCLLLIDLVLVLVQALGG